MALDHETRKKHRQLGIEIAESLDKAEARGDDRVKLLLDAVFAEASIHRWSFNQLRDRALENWYEQARIGAIAQPTLEIVDAIKRR